MPLPASFVARLALSLCCCSCQALRAPLAPMLPPLTLPAGAQATKVPSNPVLGGAAWLVAFDTSGQDTEATWSLGQLSVGRHVCLHRFKLWWLKPSHGQGGHDLPPETSLLLAETHPQPGPAGTEASTDPNACQGYLVLLPLCDTHSRAILHGLEAADSEGAPMAPGPGQVETNRARPVVGLTADTGDVGVPLPRRSVSLLVATGPDPFRLVEGAVKEATSRLQRQLELDDGHGHGPTAAGPGGGGETPGSTGAGRLPKFVDEFGWCTWDSFYTMVSPQGIFGGLAELRSRGVRPGWVVLDDGWQQTTNDDALNSEQWDECLVGLEANKRFRHVDDQGRVTADLGDTVAHIKREFGVRGILAWHALPGYWAGMEPDSPNLRDYKPVLASLRAATGIRDVDPHMQKEFDAKRFGMAPAEHALAFFTDYHATLARNGVDGIKVDAQSLLDAMGLGNKGVPAVTGAYHRALSKSLRDNFSAQDGSPAPMIHCMCHAPSVLFHIAALYQDKPVIRGSDDYYPEEDASHGPHLYTNAYNSLLVSNLGLHDWDMFQTHMGTGQVRGKASWLHAAARAVSGGPVYVSDKPGQHNEAILRKLLLEDGSVLRASTNALPTLSSLLRDPQTAQGGLLQVWAENPLPGTAVVGSFHVRGSAFSQSQRASVFHEEEASLPPVRGVVRPSDVHAFLTASSLAARSDPESTVADDHGQHKAQDQLVGDHSGSDRPGQPELLGDSELRPEGSAVTRRCHQPETEGARPVLEAEWGSGQGEGQSRFVVYLHERGEVLLLGLQDAVDLELSPFHFELATVSQVKRIAMRMPPATTHANGTSQQDGGVSWAVIGLADKFNSAAAVTCEEAVAVAAAARPKGSTTPPLAGLEPELQECAGGSDGASGDHDRSSGVPVALRLTVRGSGRLLAVAGRAPDSVVLEGGVAGSARDHSSPPDAAHGNNGPGRSQAAGAPSADSEQMDDDPLQPCGPSEGTHVPWTYSSTVLANGRSLGRSHRGDGRGDSGTNPGDEVGVSGVLEVDLPGPWTGGERRLLITWL